MLYIYGDYCNGVRSFFFQLLCVCEGETKITLQNKLLILTFIGFSSTLLELNRITPPSSTLRLRLQQQHHYSFPFSILIPSLSQLSLTSPTHQPKWKKTTTVTTTTKATMGVMKYLFLVFLKKEA